MPFTQFQTSLNVPKVTSHKGTTSTMEDMNEDGIEDLIIGAPDIDRVGSGTSNVDFGNTEPVLINNRLNIYQSQSVIITQSDLSASDQETSARDLVFTSESVSHGYFEDIRKPGIPITQFTQQIIFNGVLRFVSDGSPFAPSYFITVSDGALITKPNAAIINFFPSTEIESSSPVRDAGIRNATIGFVSGAMGLGFFALRIALSHAAENSLKRSLEQRGTSQKVI